MSRNTRFRAKIRRGFDGCGPDTGIFTDGFCDPNPGRGGWGWVRVEAGEIVDEAQGFPLERTTNNRMELWAIYAAMLTLAPTERVTIYSDSQLSINTLGNWAHGWSSKPWFHEWGTQRKNLDLIVPAYWLLADRSVQLRWVKGHAGIFWNEYADGLASGRITVSSRCPGEVGGVSSPGSVSAEVLQP